MKSVEKNTMKDERSNSSIGYGGSNNRNPEYKRYNSEGDQDKQGPGRNQPSYGEQDQRNTSGNRNSDNDRYDSDEDQNKQGPGKRQSSYGKQDPRKTSGNRDSDNDDTNDTAKKKQKKNVIYET